jgi:PPOX class probable F420-dependent enzyme
MKMPELPFPDEVRALLAKSNPAVVAYTTESGQPASVATWYLLESDDRILLNMDHTRARLRHLRADPRVSLTVLDDKNWYTHITLVGSVTGLQPDADLTDIDRLSQHYVSAPYHDRESPRVSGWIEIDRWHGWRKSHTIRTV